MHTAEYKFQIGQKVFVIDKTEDELQSGIVLQVTIDAILSSTGAVVYEKTYIIQLLTGVECSENIEVPEEDIYATVDEAAAALSQFIGDK